MTITERAIEQIINDSGEDVYLCVEQDFLDMRPAEKLWRAALRVPTMNNGQTYPLFDPVDGTIELAGYGPTTRDAFVALRVVLNRFFA